MTPVNHGARFSGQVALVTGATGAIGSSTVRRFIDEGASVVLVDLHQSLIDEHVRTLGASGARVAGFAVDLTTDHGASEAVAFAERMFGRMDVAALIAGIAGPRVPVHQLPVEQWDTVIAVNLRSVFLSLQACAVSMIARGVSGSIVTMSSSMAQWDVLDGGSAYASSKGGVLSLTRAAAFDLAPHQIRVNAVCPGVIETSLGVPSDADSGIVTPSSKQFADRIPLKRIGQPEDVASAIAYLASAEARHVTGAAWLIDGGQTLQSWRTLPPSVEHTAQKEGTSVMTRHNLYVNGQWITTPEYRDNVSPSDTSDVIGEFAIADVGAIDDAVQSARDALGPWSRTSPQHRANLLEAVAASLLHSSGDIGALLAREEGKTLKEATNEVIRAAQIFRFFSGEALRMTGERQASTREGVSVTLHREPVGVVGLITPWNFPIAIPSWKVAPALAYGNTVVLKPADLVPASAHALARILHECAFPPGVFNLVTGPGAVLGDALSRHEGIDAVSFTGSSAVGLSVADAATKNLTSVQLEMGGKNPLVVLEDANLDHAVEVAIDGAFFSTGQRCTASSRLIVVDAVHDDFVDRLQQRMTNLRVGNSLDADTEIGPVVDARQLKTDLFYLNLARDIPSSTVIGGELVSRPTNGFYLSPALIVGASNDDRPSREEIFGPVTSVIRVTDYDEALAIANDTPFGLVAGICTTSLFHAEDFQARADAGMVMVNLPTAGVDPHVPFGGRKKSSFGPHEQGSHARDFFTRTKTAYVRA